MPVKIQQKGCENERLYIQWLAVCWYRRYWHGPCHCCYECSVTAHPCVGPHGRHRCSHLASAHGLYSLALLDIIWRPVELSILVPEHTKGTVWAKAKRNPVNPHSFFISLQGTCCSDVLQRDAVTSLPCSYYNLYCLQTTFPCTPEIWSLWKDVTTLGHPYSGWYSRKRQKTLKMAVSHLSDRPLSPPSGYLAITDQQTTLG